MRLEHVACLGAIALIGAASTAPAQTLGDRTFAATPSDDGGAREAYRLIDTWLDAERAYDHVPAISVGIVANDRLAWSKGYGTIDAEGKVAATPGTIYSICSISKVFTAVAVMQEHDAGRLDIDAPIATYLPWATPIQSAAWSAPITLRNILSHSSGLPREADFQYWAAPDFQFPTTDQIQAKIGSQKTLYGAYRYYQYSNLGLTLAGDAVAAVAKRPYGDVITSRILTPLGMADTRTTMPMDLYGTRLAIGFGAIRRDGKRDQLRPFDTKGVTPAAGLTSTVEDLARFAEWQIRLLKTGKTEVLKPATLQEMQRVQFVDPAWQNFRGLGFGIYHSAQRTLVGHQGECPGYYTAMMLDRSTDSAVILMMNAAQPTAPYVNGIFDILAKRKGFSFAGTAPAKVMLEDYTGIYSEQPWGSEAVYVPWAGGLAYLPLPTSDPADDITFFKPMGGDVFRRIRPDGSEAEDVRFERDTAGKVVRVVHHNNPNPKIS